MWLSVGKSGTAKKVQASNATHHVGRHHHHVGPEGQRTIASPGHVAETPGASSQNVKASSMALIVEDPMTIIMKDRSDRDQKTWSSFSKEFQQKMANAILNDEKVFEADGKLHDRKTGKTISIEQALAELPPAKAKHMHELLKLSDPQLHMREVEAMINGEKTFIADNKIYNLAGKQLSPEHEIAQVMSQKLGIIVKTDRYEGMDQNFLLARAEALTNNKPYFLNGNITYDSFTGRNISSPFRKLASQEDVKIQKERRKLYEKLTDKEVILNYNRDFPKATTCPNYAIVDKKQANIKIYTKDGKEIYSTEVLVGAKISDQRTVFTKYGDFTKETNQSTGAGLYTIGELKSGHSYYKDNYSNNLFSLNDSKNKEMVLAIHQVPNDLTSRYSRFGTGEASDRRISGGCVNLKKNDFLQLKNYLGPHCQVYILPEEEGNHFVLKDNQLNFTSNRSLNANQIGHYNFNSTKKYAPIQITIHDARGDGKDARAFVKALSSEKQKLMHLLNLDNDDYNDLATVAYGLMGNESSFGKSNKYWLKEHDQSDVIAAKAFKASIHGHNPFSSSVSDTSRGFTQMKDIPEGEWRKAYPNLSKETLGDPKNSAVATMAFLANAITTIKNIARENEHDPKKVQISRETVMDYIGYLYQGRLHSLKSDKNPATPDRNTYVQNLRNNMSYIEISQKIE
jgi:hypothetical protein